MEKAGVLKLAVEVAAYDTPDHVSNDITLEPGLFWCEVQCEGRVLAATGAEAEAPWLCRQLTHRRSRAEMLSHCREVIEVYDLGPDTLSWVTEDLKDYQSCRVSRRTAVAAAEGMSSARNGDAAGAQFGGAWRDCRRRGEEGPGYGRPPERNAARPLVWAADRARCQASPA